MKKRFFKERLLTCILRKYVTVFLISGLFSMTDSSVVLGQSQLPSDITEHTIRAEDVDCRPRFPGCTTVKDENAAKDCTNQKLLSFIYNGRTKYPKRAFLSQTEGTCVIGFAIDTLGYITDVTVLRDPGDGIGRESARVISSMNDLSYRWIPGNHNGKTVKVSYIIPIRFKLKGED